jgi:hypothetical protein
VRNKTIVVRKRGPKEWYLVQREAYGNCVVAGLSTSRDRVTRE